jgi:PA14 domain
VFRLLGRLAHLATSAALFLLFLALLRLGPIHAEPPRPLLGLTGNPLPLLAGVVLLAILAALCGGPPPSRRPVWPFLAGLAVAASGLGLLVAGRPAAGLSARVAEGEDALAELAPGPVDFIGRDLRALPRLRRPRLDWDGELRAPQTGTYLLAAEGRGRLEVAIDDQPVLVGEGDPLRLQTRVPLKKGRHQLRIHLEREGQGARLRLAWRPPGRHARGPTVAIPPRALGKEIAAWWWLATDALAVASSALLAALVFALPWNARRALPGPRPMETREIVVSALGQAVVLVVMSWPLVTDPARLGMTNRPDGRLNAWILAWDVHAMTREPGRLFQAPAFHPLPDVLAFSENLLLPAALSAPFQWLSGPVLAYNSVLLLSLLVSGLGAQALVRRVTGDPFAAFVAGALFAAGAHRWIRLAHLHAQVTMFMPFALLALDRFWEDRRLRSALLVGGLLALQGLSSVYVGAITALFLAAAVLVMAFAGLQKMDALKLALGFALAGALLLPVVRPYLRMRATQGIEFTLEEVRTYATTLESYAASGTRLYGALTQRHLDPERVQDTLFPGVVTLALGLAGIAVAPPRYRAVAVVASIFAVVFSLGPATAFYRFLHEHLVLVRGVRALSRFSLVPVLSLCVLAGLFLAGKRRWLLAAALAAALLESSQVPLSYDRWKGPGEAAQWLAGRPGAVVVLPIGEDDTRAMLAGVAHWRPLVNGDSGFVPRPYARVLELLAAPLGEDGKRLLRAVGVTHVVSPRDERMAEMVRFSGERIFEVPSGDAAAVVSPGRPVATLWSEHAVLDQGAVRPVRRIVFELTGEPWMERPPVAASLDGLTWEPLEARASLADATLSLLRDPRHGRAQILFPRREARYLRVGTGVPALRGALEVGE